MQSALAGTNLKTKKLTSFYRQYENVIISNIKGCYFQKKKILKLNLFFIQRKIQQCTENQGT